MTAPTAGAIISGLVTLSATATGATSVEFYGTNATGTTKLFGTDTIPPYTYNWMTSYLINQPYTLKVVAKNGIGNTTSANVRVIVQN